MPVINISVENKIAEADGTLYVCGNSDFVAKFAFDAEWEAYENKTARFCYNNSYVDVVFTGDKCPVPIISGTYFFNIGVYAGDLHTTTPARVPCKKSILCDTGFPADPPDDVYNQIMAKLNSLGSADPEAIAKAVADYLAAHPIEETDPTVPEWAKADITGATVGQIAKITAVDASGVPTAWEPVDMPGGGGENFALIMDDTVPANATGYTSDKDVNGESFALREWVLILWTPAHADDDHGNFGRAVGFIPGSAWGKNVFKISDTIKKSDGTGRYDMLHIKVVDGYQMQLLHTRSQNASNAFGVMQQEVAAGNAPINFKVDATALFEPTNATGYATCVKISGYTNENVPAGTHIKLYGKRVKS
jgi:hypothetical protein